MMVVFDITNFWKYFNHPNGRDVILEREQRGEKLEDDNSGYLSNPTKFTLENLKIFSSWLGVELTVPKSFDTLSQEVQQDYRLYYSVALDAKKKVVFYAERGRDNLLETYMQVVNSDQSSFGYVDGLYSKVGYNDFKLSKKIDFNKAKILNLGQISRLRKIGLHLTGNSLEAGKEAEIKEALLSAVGVHSLSDELAMEALELLGMLTPAVEAKTEGRNIYSIYGKGEYNLISEIFDVCESKRKDGKTVRTAFIFSGQRHNYNVQLIVVDETNPIYNSLDKGRLAAVNSTHITLFSDSKADALLFTWINVNTMSDEIYDQLKASFESQIPDVMRKSKEYRGFRGQNAVSYEDLVGSMQVDKSKILQSGYLNLNVERAKQGIDNVYKQVKIDIVDCSAIRERLEEIHQTEMQRQLGDMETDVAHHLKSSKAKTGERISLAGGIIMENHTIDVMNHKTWLEYKTAGTYETKNGKIIPNKFTRVKASEIFKNADMTAEVMDLETVMSRFHLLIMHSFMDNCYPQTMEDLERIKQGNFRVHFDDVVVDFAFTRTENGSAMLKVNDCRIGMENVEKMLNRLPCFPTQKEFDAFVENISEISFAAHDLLNEGHTSPPFRFRFKREGRNWFVRKTSGEKEEWVQIPGGFRAWTSLAIDTYNFTETIKKYAAKMNIKPEEMVTVLKTARAEYGLSEARAKKLLDDTIASLNGRAKREAGTNAIEVKGTSGTWYRVHDDLKVYSLGKKRNENTYICIVDAGTANVNKTDKLVSRILALANDTASMSMISTLRAHVEKE